MKKIALLVRNVLDFSALKMVLTKFVCFLKNQEKKHITS